jgi:hypothetical protein
MIAFFAKKPCLSADEILKYLFPNGGTGVWTNSRLVDYAFGLWMGGHLSKSIFM